MLYSYTTAFLVLFKYMTRISIPTLSRSINFLQHSITNSHTLVHGATFFNHFHAIALNFTVHNPAPFKFEATWPCTRCSYDKQHMDQIKQNFLVEFQLGCGC